MRKAMLKGFDRTTLTVRLPQVYANLVGRDASFEQHASSTLQTCLLEYRRNIAQKSRAIIFFTPEMTRAGLKPLVYTDGEAKVDYYIEFFKDILNFDSVEVCRS